MTYKCLLSINVGEEILISDECNNNHFIEIGLLKPSDWDDDDWLCDPTDIENETDIDDEGEEGAAEKGEDEREKEEEQKGGDEEAAPTDIDEMANAPNNSDIDTASPLPAYLRFQWGPTAEYQALFKCDLPTITPEAFAVKLHRVSIGLEDQHLWEISVYAQSHETADKIILDDNGIPFLVALMEWSEGGGTKYGALTKAYAKRSIADEEPVLSSEEIGRILGPYQMMMKKDEWVLDTAIEDGWMESEARGTSAAHTT